MHMRRLTAFHLCWAIICNVWQTSGKNLEKIGKSLIFFTSGLVYKNSTKSEYSKYEAKNDPPLLLGVTVSASAELAPSATEWLWMVPEWKSGEKTNKEPSRMIRIASNLCSQCWCGTRGWILALLVTHLLARQHNLTFWPINKLRISQQRALVPPLAKDR